MSAVRRVLLVQHAGSLGGSVMSLRYLVQGLTSRGIEIFVAMVEPNPVVRALYEADGATVVDTPEVPLLRHTTAGWSHVGDPRACVYQAWAVARAGIGVRALRRLIAEIRPDIVHLNSVTLALMARGLSHSDPPLVWHVRESPVQGYLGIRRRFLRESLLRCADEVIFLSESDRAAWVGGLRGTVVPNVVLARGIPDADSIMRVRKRFGAAEGDRLIAYVGAYQEIKGIFPLVAAVRRLLPDLPRLRILAPGMTLGEPRSLKGRLARCMLPMLGMARDFERAERLVASADLDGVFLRQPFVTDVLPVLAAAEFLVFPSTRPHFARPVVEAAVVGRAAVGSRLGGVSDLIKDGETGLLVPAGNPAALADSMRVLLEDPALAACMGRRAAEVAAERFNADAQVDAVLEIYDKARARLRIDTAAPR